jgi:hypothetical protein
LAISVNTINVAFRHDAKAFNQKLLVIEE